MISIHMCNLSFLTVKLKRKKTAEINLIHFVQCIIMSFQHILNINKTTKKILCVPFYAKFSKSHVYFILYISV